MNWYLAVLKKYAVFDGRAHRTEYWMFFLFNFLAGIVLGLADAVISWVVPFGWLFASLGSIYSLAVLVPSIAVGVRRLHDTGRSGWWLLIGLVPLAGFIILLIFFIEDSQPGPNQYGPNPKEFGDSPNNYQSSTGGQYCRNCGTQMPPGSSFCQKCGAKT